MRISRLALALGGAALTVPFAVGTANAGQAPPGFGTAPAVASAAIAASGHHEHFRATIRPVDDATRATMIGVSWHEGCPVPIDDLRIIEMNHWGFDGSTHAGGRLMVHKDIAKDVVKVFKTMFKDRFPIRQMRLIEEYGGSDDASMAADNSSAFNCRAITGQPGEFSIHSYGKAIDINTIENPYVKGDLVLPAAGAAYLDREDVRPGMIVGDDPVVREFAKRGFDWGGGWTSLKDYQHFEIPSP